MGQGERELKNAVQRGQKIDQEESQKRCALQFLKRLYSFEKLCTNLKVRALLPADVFQADMPIM